MKTFQPMCRGPGELSCAYMSRMFSSMVLAAGIAIGLASVSGSAAAAELSELEQRGEYLTIAGGCVTCHTEENGAPFVGGRPFETPFGTIYSTNITPDPETGIGQWSLEDFAKAMREGEAPGGKHLYPVFPYTSYALINDQDMEAIYAYFRTIEPVNYTPPENSLGFPYNQRWALGFWKMLFLDSTPFEPDPEQSAEWNRGAYLVEGLGHCSECHTPRNFLGAKNSGLAMTGGVYMDRVEGKWSEWSAPNMTSDVSGLAAWSIDDITDYLKLGISDRSGIYGPMNDVVVNSTRHLEREDVRAMAVYLKSLPANAQDSGAPASADVLRTGSLQYDIHCGSCHLPTGLGAREQGPPLVGNPVVLDANPQSLINVTLYGGQRPHIHPSREWEASQWIHMEPFQNILSDEQVAAILSFIRASWGHEAGAVTAEQVARQR
ncbi:c-type cytochrome [Pseudohongiella spirulinae]|uniref:Gluconate 2-dehydrogenase cytochrome c subunit n=1 Tax=Pseudohongiella spirulinae TaxID=1249552 RepID=A0A0S2KGV2_9GAMM|nr:cytochrome c [Pseudohongiella spirulinae]ALO47413.1 Gluconate 2-dehydrogenase cytochrome c subunit [Pseudohongiella spirulinae]